MTCPTPVIRPASVTDDDLVLLPADQALERCCLASLIITGMEPTRFAEIIEALEPAGKDAFLDPDYATIYTSILSVAGRCAGHFDAVLVWHELTRAGSEVRWEDFTSIINGLPTADHGVYYGKALVSLWRQREAWRICTALAQAMARPMTQESVGSLIWSAIADMAGIAPEQRPVVGPMDGSEVSR